MKKLTCFGLNPEDTFCGKFKIICRLGSGWEGEVYKIREINSGVERAAKLFFPHRNPRQKTSRFYARKLHKLRQCRMLIQYHTEETIYLDGIPVTVLVSEYVEGQLLSEFVKTFPGRRIKPYVAAHLLYALALGIEEIHLLDEYHGDLHTDNVIVNHFGLEFDLKLLDMYGWGAPTRANRDHDLLTLIRIFYDILGGAKFYSQHPSEIKHICCGLKGSLIKEKFRTVSQLREHLECLSWDGRIL